MFSVRCSIEGQAIREACPNLTSADHTTLQDLILQQEASADPNSQLELDWQFHQTIYQASHNELLQEIIVSLWARTRQARSLAQVDTGWGRQWNQNSVARHRKILAALRNQNGLQAEEEIIAAVKIAEGELIKGLKDTGWGDSQ